MKKEEKDFFKFCWGIENKVFIKIGDQKITAEPEDDTERTSEEGKSVLSSFSAF